LEKGLIHILKELIMTYPIAAMMVTHPYEVTQQAPYFTSKMKERNDLLTNFETPCTTLASTGNHTLAAVFKQALPLLQLNMVSLMPSYNSLVRRWQSAAYLSYTTTPHDKLASIISVLSIPSQQALRLCTTSDPQYYGIQMIQYYTATPSLILDEWVNPQIVACTCRGICRRETK